MDLNRYLKNFTDRLCGTTIRSQRVTHGSLAGQCFPCGRTDYRLFIHLIPPLNNCDEEGCGSPEYAFVDLASWKDVVEAMRKPHGQDWILEDEEFPPELADGHCGELPDDDHGKDF